MAGERILVVDDEAEIVELLRDVLGGEGYVVDGAQDAASSLQLVRENIYDGALLDFNLPDMDGVMLHHQIRQMDAELASRTIFMSGLVQSDDNLGYYTSHSAGFLAKPFDIGDVLRNVRAVLSEIGEINTLHKPNVEQAGFAVLKAPDIPSILVETAFISNPDEEKRLKSDAYQEKMAEALVAGIRNYFSKNPPLARERLVQNQ